MRAAGGDGMKMVVVAYQLTWGEVRMESPGRESGDSRIAWGGANQVAGDNQQSTQTCEFVQHHTKIIPTTEP